MLTSEENELITRVGPGTWMGRVLRSIGCRCRSPRRSRPTERRCGTAARRRPDRVSRHRRERRCGRSVLPARRAPLFFGRNEGRIALRVPRLEFDATGAVSTCRRSPGPLFLLQGPRYGVSRAAEAQRRGVGRISAPQRSAGYRRLNGTCSGHAHATSPSACSTATGSRPPKAASIRVTRVSCMRRCTAIRARPTCATGSTSAR